MNRLIVQLETMPYIHDDEREEGLDQTLKAMFTYWLVSRLVLLLWLGHCGGVRCKSGLSQYLCSLKYL